MKAKCLILLIFTFLCFFHSSLAQSSVNTHILDRYHLTHLKDSIKYIYEFTNGYARIFELNDRLNYMDTTGRKVHPDFAVIEFSQAGTKDNFPKKYFVFTGKSGNKGLLDSAGNILIAPVYWQIAFKYSYIILNNGSREYLMDANLNLVIYTVYNHIEAVNDSLVIVTMEDKDIHANMTGVFNIRTKKEIIPAARYKRINNINWAFVAYKDSSCGVFDFAGNLIIPFDRYSQVVAEYDSKFLHGGNSAGENVMDSAGKVIIPAGLYEEIMGYTKNVGFFLVKKNGLWGAINIKNEIVIPIVYNSLEGFSDDGISRASQDGETFFISQKNYRLGTHKYQSNEGYRKYVNKDTTGYVDESGQIFSFPEYKFIDNYKKLLIPVCTKNNMWGGMNGNFKLIIDTVYDKLQNYYTDYVIVIKNNKYGVIDMLGNIAIPVTNDMIYSRGNNEFEVTNGANKQIIKLKPPK